MKPNILFVVIDSFRADKAQGENRTCKTPNIDKLVKNGTYFEQAITSSDATPLSIRSIFTSLLPFKTGTVFQPKTDQGIKSIIDFLKNEGYNLYATVPNFKHVEFLYSSFENEDKFIEIEKNWPRLDEGLGDKIIKKISSLKQPWFYYIHPLDIHAKVLPGTSSIKIPKKFESKEYGNSKYEKAISALDEWIGRILEKIDLDNTIIVITADHGTYIPFYQKGEIKIDLEEDGITKITPKSHIPKLILPIARKIFYKNKSMKYKKVLEKIKNYNLDNSVKRNLMSKKFNSTEESAILFDDLVHVPLIFQGPKIPKKMIVKQQVSNIDILPTILEIINADVDFNQFDGTSLCKFFRNETVKEKPIFLQSVFPWEKEEYSIGIRTSKYKYNRSIINENENQYLFDLENDPIEVNNIVKTNPQIVKEMEQILQNTLKNKELTSKEKDEKEYEMVKDELKKLGYL